MTNSNPYNIRGCKLSLKNKQKKKIYLCQSFIDGISLSTGKFLKIQKLIRNRIRRHSYIPKVFT